jgi:phage terminase small subunit
MARRPDPLTPRQRLFVVAFVNKGGIATQAALTAGYSEASADQQGWALLKNPKVAAEIAKGRNKLAVRLEINGAALLQAMARIALSDARRLFGPDGKLLSVHALDDDTAGAISSVEVRHDARTGERVTKVRLADKNAGQRNLAVCLGMGGMVRPGGMVLAGAAGEENQERQAARADLDCLDDTERGQLMAILDKIELARERRAQAPLLEQSAQPPEEPPGEG